MKQQQRAARKRPDYPETTAGSRLASKARKLASKLTPKQRREHFNGAMAMIYAGGKRNNSHSTLILSSILPGRKILPTICWKLPKREGTPCFCRPPLPTNYISFSLTAKAKQNGNWHEGH